MFPKSPWDFGRLGGCCFEVELKARFRPQHPNRLQHTYLSRESHRSDCVAALINQSSPRAPGSAHILQVKNSRSSPAMSRRVRCNLRTVSAHQHTAPPPHAFLAGVPPIVPRLRLPRTAKARPDSFDTTRFQKAAHLGAEFAVTIKDDDVAVWVGEFAPELLWPARFDVRRTLSLKRDGVGQRGGRLPN
jgi:hypothetical protein